MHDGPSRDLSILAAAVGAMALLALVGAVLAPAGGSQELNGSSFGSGPKGTRAAYLLLQRLGYRVERSFAPISDMAADPGTTLLVVASPALPAADVDCRALARFVRAGGIVLATGSVRDLLPHLTTRPAERIDARQDDATLTARAGTPSDLTAGITSTAVNEEAVAPADTGPYVAILDAGRTPAALTARIGAGRVIWWAGSSPFMNGTIADAGHLDLLLDALGPPGAKRVIWDESSHGHTRSVWSYIGTTPLPAALAQALLLTLVIVSRYGRRWLPVREGASSPRTPPLEFVDAVAGLYHGAGISTGPVETSLARTRRLLATAAGLPLDADDARLAGAAARLGLEPTTVATLLTDSRAAAAGASPPRTALLLVQRLQELGAAAGRARSHPRPGLRADQE